mmetsp:Transcript_20296/g.40521  ORF Transcript_20296/g.40521 Transcript_20296/m.40521 type:complete len:168 (+) Transcript_20296:68-571(+)|eukprot:CAMPEP_0194323120 /NCGR_PEP_ID=MMETSP0171-20130528/24060_1 /TAXON_ID=218684 /ORGANISM="Corethron pennatum, Strain L29A3" /LENGTH=167 /DNA_ID=CAMNT_0039081629 /DNA_START=31 /DNA_END=534 /DNA_ORIENTATION=+
MTFFYAIAALLIGNACNAFAPPAFSRGDHTPTALMSEYEPLPTNVCPSTLPGDPSLILTTNVDLGDKKMEIMKACSKAIASNLEKPESYVAVSINDNASVIFGGSDKPTALGVVYSLGSISKENNGGLTKDVSELMEPFGVDAARIYINFFDLPRENVGWSGKTFAG